LATGQITHNNAVTKFSFIIEKIMKSFSICFGHTVVFLISGRLGCVWDTAELKVQNKICI
jgi:hypothetical protein